LGRWAMVLALFAFPYARGPSGLGYYFKEGARWPAFLVATAFAAGPALALLPAGAAAGVMVLAGALSLGLGRWMSGRLGGLTGDVYGAVCEVVETASLITVPLLMRTVGPIN
ncbi:MAG: adenosylcobinamide-GDP ribazoletransferase, partial [Desulfotomaculales bacterium]